MIVYNPRRRQRFIKTSGFKNHRFPLIRSYSFSEAGQFRYGSLGYTRYADGWRVTGFNVLSGERYYLYPLGIVER